MPLQPATTAAKQKRKKWKWNCTANGEFRNNLVPQDKIYGPMDVIVRCICLWILHYLSANMHEPNVGTFACASMGHTGTRFIFPSFPWHCVYDVHGAHYRVFQTFCNEAKARKREPMPNLGIVRESIETENHNNVEAPNKLHVVDQEIYEQWTQCTLYTPHSERKHKFCVSASDIMVWTQWLTSEIAQ